VALLAQTMRREAVTMAFADVFYLMASLFVAALIFVPLLKPARPLTAEAQKEAH